MRQIALEEAAKRHGEVIRDEGQPAMTGEELFARSSSLSSERAYRRKRQISRAKPALRARIAVSLSTAEQFPATTQRSLRVELLEEAA
jgi:hypothetical protein